MTINEAKQRLEKNIDTETFNVNFVKNYKNCYLFLLETKDISAIPNKLIAAFNNTTEKIGYSIYSEDEAVAATN